MPIHAGGALNYAVRMMHEDPEDPRIIENQFEWLNTAKNYIVEFSQWKWLQAFGDLEVPQSGVIYFPNYVWQVLSFFPSAFGYRRPTQFIGAYQFDAAGPSVSAGLADYTIEWGYYGVHADVSQNGQITVTSDAAASGDDGVQVMIEGLDTTAARNQIFETVTLVAGTATTTKSFREGSDGVRRVTVAFDSLFNADGSSKTRGILTATDVTGLSIERLDLSREIHHEHVRAELFPTTNGPNYILRYFKRVPDIISLNHVFEIPNEFQDAYHYALRAQIAEFQRGPGAGAADWQSAERKVRKMIVRQERQPARRRGFVPNQSYRFRAWRW